MTTPSPKAFVSKRAALEFTIDSELFLAHGTIPADHMAVLADRLDEVNKLDLQREQFSGMKELISEFMEAESGERFKARCSSWENPVGIAALNEISAWLMEQVSGRPTSPPESSTNSPEEAGTTLTDGAPVEESIPGL